MLTGGLSPEHPRSLGLASHGQESGYFRIALKNNNTGNALHGVAGQQQLSVCSPGLPVSVGGSEAFNRQGGIEANQRQDGEEAYHRQSGGGEKFAPDGAGARGYHPVRLTEFQYGGSSRQFVESELDGQDGRPLGFRGGFSGGDNGSGGHQGQPTPGGRWSSFPHDRAEGSSHGGLWGWNGPTKLPTNQPKLQRGVASLAHSYSTFGGYENTPGPVFYPIGITVGGASAGSLPSAPPRFSSASPGSSAPGVGPAPETIARPNSAATGGISMPYNVWSVAGELTNLTGEYGSHIKDVSPRPDMDNKSVAISDNGSPVFDGSDGVWEDYTNSAIHEGVLVRESGDLMRLSAMPPRFDPTSVQSAVGTYQAMAASSEEFESHFLERSQALRAYSYSLPSACRPGASLKAQAPLATAIARRMGTLSDENQELRNLTWGGAGSARCHPERGLELQRLQEQLGKVRDFNQAAGGAIKGLAKELQEANTALRKACRQIELLGGVNGTSGTKILENVQKGYAPPREIMIGGWKYVAVGKVPAATAAASSAQTETKASSPQVGNRKFDGTKAPAPKNPVRGRGGRGGGRGFRGRGQVQKNVSRKDSAGFPTQ